MDLSLLTNENIIIIILVALFVILIVIIILFIILKNSIVKMFANNVKEIVDTNSDNNLDLLDKILRQNYDLRDDVSTKINNKFNDVINEYNTRSDKATKDLFDNIDNLRRVNDEKLETIRRTNEEKLEKINNSTQGVIQTISNGLETIRTTNEQKLDLINERVNEKLEKNLSEKLAQNFTQIDQTLQNLQRSLGEITQLSSNVGDLKKIFSNTKTRGVFGEVQLENILANIMDKSQYETQFKLRQDSEEKVDFAIKIPDKENSGKVIYIPIDAKFNIDIYSKIVEASDNCDKQSLEHAQKELKSSIEAQAKSINEKYIHPPITSEFAIMFLPSEGIYSEVLRIGDLANTCLSKYKILVAGPTSITAIINSLSIGFKYLKINENSREIVKLLENVKKQFSTNEENIKRLKKHLMDAQKSTDEIESRNNKIVKNLSKLNTKEDEIDNIDALQIGDGVD